MTRSTAVFWQVHRAGEDVFDYIEFFYNPKRKHGHNGMLSPVEFEQQQNWKAKGVYETRSYYRDSSS